MEQISFILENAPVNIAKYNTDRNGQRWNSAANKIYKKCLYDKLDPFNTELRPYILDGLKYFGMTRKGMMGQSPFLTANQFRRLLALRGGELVLKDATIQEEARYDGKWVLRTNTGLSAEEVALAYKGLWHIEHAFRELKSGLEIRPIYLQTGEHVIVHIMVCFLALVMEAAQKRLLKENGIQDSYRDVLNDLEGVRAIQLKANGKSWLVRTELRERAFQAFKVVGLRPPVHVQPLS